MALRELTTPAALVEWGRLQRNIERMNRRLHSLGVVLRPHVKTHKCIEAARLQVRGWPGAITVSTMAEARFFARHGFADILYAVPVAPGRVLEAAELSRQIAAFHVLVDGPEMVTELERCAEAQGVVFSVFLKVDCGYHRAGVLPHRSESRELAERLAGSSCLSFRGLLTHAGHSYRCHSRAEVQAVAEEEREAVVRLAGLLRERGRNVAEVSVGSTPTMTAVQDLSGVTEARPGNYVFFDAFQTAIGSCSLDDCAFTVLATVVGRHEDPPRLVIDAGALALSKDTGPSHIDPACGFGVIFTADMRCRLGDLTLGSLSQEHGVITAPSPDRLVQLPVGIRLRIVPNHSCLAAALFDRYAVVEGDEIVDEWRPIRGW